MGNDISEMTLTTSDRIASAIRPLERRDLPAMATIHAGSGTPGLLTDLGKLFLERVYYAGLLDDPHSGGAAIEIRNELAGFVTYSRDSSRLFRSIVFRRPVAFTTNIIRSGLRRPHLFWNVFESVAHIQGDRLASRVSAEIVSLEVSPAFQKLGLGYFLIERAITELRAEHPVPVKVRIFPEHRAVAQLYEHFGFREAGTFKLHGRKWAMLVNDEPRTTT